MGRKPGAAAIGRRRCSRGGELRRAIALEAAAGKSEFQARIALGAKTSERSVARAIVHCDNLEIAATLAEHAGKAACHEALPVMGRDDDAEERSAAERLHGRL